MESVRWWVVLPYKYKYGAPNLTFLGLWPCKVLAKELHALVGHFIEWNISSAKGRPFCKCETCILMGISLLKGLGSFSSFIILWYLVETPNTNQKKMKKWKNICCAYNDTQEGDEHTNTKVIHKVTQSGGKTN